jgi:hypothetical protein
VWDGLLARWTRRLGHIASLQGRRVIATRTEDALLLRRLVRALPMIHEKLGEAAAWRGIHVTEPELEETYLRIVSRDDLVAGDVRLGVAVHLFERTGYAGRMHDHRWPIAVMPLDLEGRAGEPLYAMPWEVRRDDAVVERGELVVRSGAPWAIERCSDVFHAVRSIQSHLSIVVSDVSGPAARANRMVTSPLTEAEVGVIAERGRTLLGALLSKG